MNTTITVHSSEQYDGDFPLRYDTGRKLIDFVAWLNAKLDEIPSEWRSSATIDIDSVGSYENSHYATITIEYTRPETPEEAAAREAQERRYSDLKRADELRQLAELQAKYSLSPPAAAGNDPERSIE